MSGSVLLINSSREIRHDTKSTILILLETVLYAETSTHLFFYISNCLNTIKCHGISTPILSRPRQRLNFLLCSDRETLFPVETIKTVTRDEIIFLQNFQPFFCLFWNECSFLDRDLRSIKSR